MKLTSGAQGRLPYKRHWRLEVPMQGVGGLYCNQKLS